MHPVLFTARDGATLSGTVWATRSGPAKRPGIVITTGSVQAPETLYWGLAATLAKHGYVVLTYDVQGQGRSDTFGDGAGQAGGSARAGRPALLRRHRGRAQLLPLEAQEPVRAADELRQRQQRRRHEPRGQAEAAGERGLRRRVQPVLEDARPLAGGHRRPLARRRRPSPTSARSTRAWTRPSPGTT